eukprot:4034429-Prymnesium_polylepis.1
MTPDRPLPCGPQRPLPDDAVPSSSVALPTGRSLVRRCPRSPVTLSPPRSRLCPVRGRPAVAVRSAPAQSAAS